MTSRREAGEAPLFRGFPTSGRALARFGAGIILAIALVSARPGLAIPSLDTEAGYAFLMDYETGAVLLEKNADEPMAPASMSKLMTVYMAFEALANGSLKLEDTLPVSKKAWQMQGSKMFVKVNTRVSINDLLHGIIIQSGNDACVVVAEGIGGTEESFADMMNERAKEIGLTNSYFTNSTGWPDPEHRMSARDLATLSKVLIQRFPQYYSIFAETEFTYEADITSGRPIKQYNRNPLLFTMEGADGLKTGHTEESLYGLTASAVRGGQRLILVVNGLPSERARATESERLMTYGFRNFKSYHLFKAGQSVEQARVWLGDKEVIDLEATNDVTVTLARRSRQNMKVSVEYNSPIPAPIAKGQEVAQLVVEAPDYEPIRIPLVAREDVGQLGMFSRIGAAFKFLLWGASSQ